jgi:hypothetical protein
MKALLAIAHYYRAEENSDFASTGQAAREERAAAIRRVIDAWRGHLDEASLLNVGRRAFEPLRGFEPALDIVVMVRGDDHLLDPEYCARRQVRIVQVQCDNPRMLPFAAQSLFADCRQAYDMFVYSEDDLKPADGLLLTKIASFAQEFGWRRLAMPNRYEWNPQAPTLKTFIDGDLRKDITERFFTALPDEPILVQPALGRAITYVRARNPHSGMFALTAEQLGYWMQQPHFNDLDCSFIRSLESAATLGVLKTFSIYKAHARDMGWLEIEHLDRRYSSIPLPRVGRRGAP